MNEPISLTEAHDVISPDRVRALVRSLHTSNAEWNEREVPGWDETARARAVGGRFYFRLTEELALDSGVHHGESSQQRFVAFDDRLSLRCKHLNRNLASSNFPTPQATAWVRAGQPLEGFTFDRLHFGYRLDALGRELRDVFICQPTGVESQPNSWIWQVYGSPIDVSTFGFQRGFGKSTPLLSQHYLFEDYAADL